MRIPAEVFQQTAARLSRILGAAGADTLDVAVEECLALTGQATGVDVAFAMLVDPSECVTDDWNWVRDGIDVSAPAPGSPLRDTFGSVVEVLRLGHTVAVADLAEIELAPSERALATRNDLRAILLAPVRIGSTLLGVTGLQMIGRPRAWPRPVVEHCDIVAQMLVQTVRRTRDRGALAAMDARARRIAEFIPDGLLLLDPAGTIGWASPSFLRSSGQREADLVGRMVTDVVHPSDRTSLLAAVEAEPLGGSDLVVRVSAGSGWRWTDVSWRLVQEDDPAVPDEIVVSLRDVHDRYLHAQELVRQTHHDPLTGLLNRAGLAARLEERTEADDPVVVAFVDVDHFKAINDGHGHDAGDRVLEAVAADLGRAVRPTDLVARLGGDEFCIVAVDEPPAPHALAQRIVDAVRAGPGGRLPAASVSVGVAGPGRSSDVAALQRRADEAMYRAKRAGGDTFALDA